MRPLALVLALTACAAPAPPQPEPPPWDGGDTAQACAEACGRLQVLGCAAGEPDEDGAPCTEVCANVESLQVGLYHAGCVALADSCEGADRCSR